MADEKKPQDQEMIKPTKGDSEELSDKDLEHTSGGHVEKGWIDISKV